MGTRLVWTDLPKQSWTDQLDCSLLYGKHLWAQQRKRKSCKQTSSIYIYKDLKSILCSSRRHTICGTRGQERSQFSVCDRKQKTLRNWSSKRIILYIFGFVIDQIAPKVCLGPAAALSRAIFAKEYGHLEAIDIIYVVKKLNKYLIQSLFYHFSGKLILMN